MDQKRKKESLSKTYNRDSRILFGCGLFLFLIECYKQAFLYTQVFNHTYNWWYFPWQLCSMSMYMCLILPWIPEKWGRVLCTFMQDFGILGGVSALIVSDGFRGLHWSLTLHGYVWHIMLIAIGIYIATHHMGISGLTGYMQTLPTFAVVCVIAQLINNVAYNGGADMFYISPYYDTLQPVLDVIESKLGRLPEIAIYICLICIGGWIVHAVVGRVCDGRRTR